MNTQHLVDLGQKLLGASDARDRARILVDEVPAKTLAAVGLAKSGHSSVGLPIGAFLAGAVVGAGAVILFVPGGEEMRRELSAKLAAFASSFKSKKAGKGETGKDSEKDSDESSAPMFGRGAKQSSSDKSSETDSASATSNSATPPNGGTSQPGSNQNQNQNQQRRHSGARA